jgi:hypothetical protein
MPDITFLLPLIGDPGSAPRYRACDLLAEIDGNTFVVDV